jgi:hypothetical protein
VIPIGVANTTIQTILLRGKLMFQCFRSSSMMPPTIVNGILGNLFRHGHQRLKLRRKLARIVIPTAQNRDIVQSHTGSDALLQKLTGQAEIVKSPLRNLQPLL